MQEGAGGRELDSHTAIFFLFELEITVFFFLLRSSKVVTFNFQKKPAILRYGYHFVFSVGSKEPLIVTIR